MHEAYLLKYLQEYNGYALENMTTFNHDINTKIRAYMNITMPRDLSIEFYDKEAEYLKDLLTKKKVISDVEILNNHKIAIYKGDITLIKCDAIVNACNSKLLGCFIPLHYCIDNAIHTFAGLEMRRDLMEIMEKQGHDEPVGLCKVTSGYNLPARYVFHTVGPSIDGHPSFDDEEDLKNCYLNCLKEAKTMHLKSLVFCSISTGVFSFPIEEASIIAIKTVKEFLESNPGDLCVIFDVFSDNDYEVYKKNLGSNYLD
jgi:O-acetyl-ADP-ribose deacetylase (regulator of RNase III)